VTGLGKAILWLVVESLPGMVRAIRARRAARNATESRAADDAILCKTIDTAKKARELAAKRKQGN
jgi:hypothetical protein